MNVTAPEKIVFDEEELKMYEGYDLNQVRAEVRKMNMEIDCHTQMTPNEVRKLIRKNEVMFSKIDKVEDSVHDARLVKNISLIVQNNMSRLSANAITFRHEDFAKKLCLCLTESKNGTTDGVMTKAMLIKLGFQAKKFVMKSPTLSVMKGAIRHKSDVMKPTAPKEKKARQVARKRDCDLVATQATVLQETETTDAQGDRKVVNLWKIIVSIYKRLKGPINYFQLVIEPNSFASTVQNVFHVSYLVKEGKLSIILKDGIPYLNPMKVNERDADAQDNKQIVMNINMALWEKMTRLLREANLEPLLASVKY
jgi:hypothetical protein